MQIYDVSMTISPQMVIWPGDTPLEINLTTDMKAGSHHNLSGLRLSAHTGTHVDAPLHFIDDGAAIETLDLDMLIGPALLLHLPDEVTRITAAILELLKIPPGLERLLLRTRNSSRRIYEQREFQEDFVGLAPDGAEWLVTRGVRLIGLDYLSVAEYKNSQAVHLPLLAAGVILLEGLTLADIPPGLYQLICLPLKLKGVEGAPARVVLIR
jgi:arylformamidase